MRINARAHYVAALFFLRRIKTPGVPIARVNRARQDKLEGVVGALCWRVFCFGCLIDRSPTGGRALIMAQRGVRVL